MIRTVDMEIDKNYNAAMSGVPINSRSYNSGEIVKMEKKPEFKEHFFINSPL